LLIYNLLAHIGRSWKTASKIAKFYFLKM